MAKIKSLDELKKLREKLQNKVELREKGENVDDLVQIKIAMATCGIAAGAKDTMDAFIGKLNEKNIKNAVITQTGCMGYCHSEPTVEITLPGKEAVVFGNVDADKTEEIIEKYIKNGELVDGIIPVGYTTIEEEK
ncbi:(2Fe-2S) ferredoxin domain-containing protein [Haliovirga abyssi]|uniref:NADP oxidoreductase n=1 Tax=Haliovirga abyssi TaxID=2996794 RepID=A0AAU9DL66_9FUSO|nr:(2Fe-2S) ferredoxin domain-containing protein [Haliovirga abyssi]BDU50667.1 NADP oxidoreductase [Haliovirga abyssi]